MNQISITIKKIENGYVISLYDHKKGLNKEWAANTKEQVGIIVDTILTKEK